MHEQTTKGFGKMNICITRFGMRIGDRKYLNEYTPFGSVSLWAVLGSSDNIQHPGHEACGQRNLQIASRGAGERLGTHSENVRVGLSRARKSDSAFQ